MALVVRLAAGDANRRIILTSGPSDGPRRRAIGEARGTGSAPRGPARSGVRRAHAGRTPRAGVARRAVHRRRQRPAARRRDDGRADRGAVRADAGRAVGAVARSARWSPRPVDGGPLPCRPCDQRRCEPGDFRCLHRLRAGTVVDGGRTGPRATPAATRADVDERDRDCRGSLRRATARSRRASRPCSAFVAALAALDCSGGDPARHHAWSCWAGCVVGATTSASRCRACSGRWPPTPASRCCRRCSPRPGRQPRDCKQLLLFLIVPGRLPARPRDRALTRHRRHHHGRRAQRRRRHRAVRHPRTTTTSAGGPRAR